MANMQHIPYYVEGKVVKGFGRGSKELGIPTANFSEKVVRNIPETLSCGVYYGWARVNNEEILPMVMSIGWNPYYKNTVKSMETHIMHRFKEDFYGSTLKVIILGYIRPMTSFSSLDELIRAINSDIAFAQEKLAAPELQRYKENNLFGEWSTAQQHHIQLSEPSHL